MTPQELERTIEFILQHEAQTVVHLERLAQGHADLVVRMTELAEGHADMRVRMTELAEGHADMRVRMTQLAEGHADMRTLLVRMTELAEVQSRRLDGHDQTLQSIQLWQRDALNRLDAILDRLIGPS